MTEQKYLSTRELKFTYKNKKCSASILHNRQTTTLSLTTKKQTKENPLHLEFACTGHIYYFIL